MKKIISKLHNSPLLGKIIHTLDYCLQKELADCESVLDLGCGPSSPIQRCKKVKYSVGVEAFQPYLEESKKKKIHTEYIDKNIGEVDFPENSFDAVIMIEVLEHLPKEVGLSILKKSEKWARKKVIVSTPNGYFPMGDVDGNTYQKHLSGWDVNELAKLGFKNHGLSGLKFFYQKNNTVQSLFNNDTIFENVRFKPKKIFYAINGIAQVIAYHLPQKAFGLFAIIRKRRSHPPLSNTTSGIVPINSRAISAR